MIEAIRKTANSHAQKRICVLQIFEKWYIMNRCYSLAFHGLCHN